MSLARLAEKWGSDHYPPEAISAADLQLVEEHFDTQLPADYRQAVLEIGLPSTTIALLDAIVERELDIAPVGDFLSPPEMIEQTVDWRDMGMPQSLLAFASDGGGNMFCFDEVLLRTGAPDSGSVWFFDHDFDTVEVVAPSFTAWIQALCDVEPWEGAASE